MGATPLPLRRISAYSESLRNVSCVTCESSLGGRTTDVLPTLRDTFLFGLQLSGPVLERIGKFVAARKLSSHPITVFVDPKQTQNGFDGGRWLIRKGYLTPKHITYISRTSITQCLGFQSSVNVSCLICSPLPSFILFFSWAQLSVDHRK